MLRKVLILLLSLLGSPILAQQPFRTVQSSQDPTGPLGLLTNLNGGQEIDLINAPTTASQSFALWQTGNNNVRQLLFTISPSGATFNVPINGSIANTFSDFIHDDGAAINSALTAASNTGGGWVLLNPSQPYWASTQITIPAGVTLGCVAPPQKQLTNPNYVSVGCSVYLTPNNTLIVNGALRNAHILQDNLHFAGNPTTSHGLAAITANYVNTGTGIKLNAADAIAEDIAIAGFNLDIDENSLNRGSLRHVLLEGQNCIKVETVGDYLKWLDVECWPFYSTNRSFSTIVGSISNVADNGSGAWRVTLSSAPSEALQTGDEVYIGGTGAFNIPFGARGHHTGITVINSTTFDLTGSQDAPTVAGNTTSGSAYVTGLASLVNLWPGMTFTGSCFTGTRTIKKLVPGQLAFVADAAATSTTPGCSLSFVLGTFSAGGTPQVVYDPRGGLHGIGIEVNGTGVIADSVFIWAHDTALQVDSGISSLIIDGFSLDGNGASNRNDRTGILFQSGAVQNKISGASLTSGGVAIINKSGASNSTSNIVSPGRVQNWVWGSIENNSGEFSVSGIYDPDNSALSGQNGDIFAIAGQTLQITNGSRLTNSVIYTDTGLGTQVIIDDGSIVSNVTPFNCPTAIYGSTGLGQCKFNASIAIDGTIPTSCTPAAAAGTGATCAFSGGSSSSNGTLAITAGTSGTTGAGSVAIAFASNLPGGVPACVSGYDQTGTGSWITAGATPSMISAAAASGITIAWSLTNAMVSGSTYRIMYHCFGK